MPWTGQSFHEHNHGLSPEQSLHAAHIANAILKRSGNEGMAIATANKLIHRDDGGMIPAAPTGGLAPSNATSSPQTQNIIARFSALPAEQLQELLPRLPANMAQIAQHVLQQKRMTPAVNQPQQPTPAMPQYGVQAQGMATGGGMRGADETVPILAAGGEFVIAPHHVAKLGDGDVHEGHRRLDKWVVDTRKKIVEKMRTLKPPVKS